MPLIPIRPFPMAASQTPSRTRAPRSIPLRARVGEGSLKRIVIEDHVSECDYPVDGRELDSLDMPRSWPRTGNRWAASRT